MIQSGFSESPGASEESRLRLRLAQEMIARCPASWESWHLAIALTGSASRGLADADSDIELNVWGHSLPGIGERETWLRSLGADEIALAVEVTEDGTTWDRWRYREVWVEAGWQLVSALEASLQGTMRGELIEHAHLVLAEVVTHALPLRGAETLRAWQGMLARYPDALRQRLIETTVAMWSAPYTAITRWSPVRRDQPLTVMEEIIRDTHGVLRLLFALNREWEPDWKWIAALSARLARQPDRLVERIAACLGQTPARERMRACTQLILDTLALLPPTEEIEQARTHLQRGLDAN